MLRGFSPPHVLVVTPTETLAASLLSWLSAAGFAVTVTADFLEARNRLGRKPDLIVSELKLGAYNGLHLAVRANGTPVLVLGDQDPVLQIESQNVGATYLVPPFSKEPVMAVVEQLLARPRETLST